MKYVIIPAFHDQEDPYSFLDDEDFRDMMVSHVTNRLILNGQLLKFVWR